MRNKILLEAILPLMRIMNPGCVESCGTTVNFWPQFRCERHHTCFSFFFFFFPYIYISFYSTRAFTQCIMHLTWVLNWLDWAQRYLLNELFLCNLCVCFVPTMNWKNSLSMSSLPPHHFVLALVDFELFIN